MKTLKQYQELVEKLAYRLNNLRKDHKRLQTHYLLYRGFYNTEVLRRGKYTDDYIKERDLVIKLVRLIQDDRKKSMTLPNDYQEIIQEAEELYQLAKMKERQSNILLNNFIEKVDPFLKTTIEGE